jgi:hypothetical protein
MNWYTAKVMADGYAAERHLAAEAHRRARSATRATPPAKGRPRAPHWWARLRSGSGPTRLRVPMVARSVDRTAC